ncbi:MAG TPA: asparagine synthase (glutamine-hydrolyzing) [Oligoflexia bacterium]|mgnify:CR=1 FL=1|nr:asparagine synthase (glutamine-hydrolyzing) [Oligoflexia bacterium]
MCGIAGIVDYASSPTVDFVDRMVDLLTHRGPDDRGTYLDGPLGFGMRRLSIIDLSTGHQPICNEDRTLWIVFNGEIYNFLQLRQDLLDKGHKFSTQTDTETIIHLYEEYGTDCVSKLQGMFAFAIYNRQAQSLFIARDRFGIKPFYYSWNGERFLFSSEMKSLLADNKLRRKLNCDAVAQYFTFLYVPGDETLFAGIKKLLPGHTLTLDGRNLTVAQYYSLTSIQPDYTGCSTEDWVTRFLDFGAETIKKHLISDVPLGAFLSGGIDSSLVVAVMSRLIDRPVNTFSIGYEIDGASFDELRYAKIVAEYYQTNHRELLITPQMAACSLPVMLSRLDEPIGDASVIPNYLLSEFARRHVTVVLSGLGGDEVCAGYERYLGAVLAERFSFLAPFFSCAAVRWGVSKLPDSKTGLHFPERLKRFVASCSLPVEQFYFQLISKFNQEEQQRLFSSDFRVTLKHNTSTQIYDRYWQSSAGFSLLRRLMKMDIDSYLADDLLSLSDRASMAHSLEMRVPFVDHQLVEFFWKMPDNMRLRGFNKKFLLKKVAEKLLPREVIYRRKQGFSVPLTVWFRGSLNSYLRDMLSEQNLESLGLFNQAYIQQLLDEHEKRARNHDEKLFSLLAFVVWYNAFFE